MPPNYIEHLTIDTGDQRRSYRTEVADEVVAMLRPLLDRVADGDRVDVPGDVSPRCTMHGARGRNSTLVVTVSAAEQPTKVPLPLQDVLLSVAGVRHIPLVSVGLAPSSRAADEVWHAMTQRTRDDRTPSAPWCAVRIYPTLALYPQASAWLGDLERCIAWAWIG